MIFVGKRAQGATEYLIILAVVIVIALIVVGVLGGIPAIGDNSGQQAAESYWGTTAIGVTNYYLPAGADRFFMTLKNNQEDSVKIISVQVAGVTNSSQKTLSPGARGEYSLAKDCTNQGDAFSFETTIEYQDIDSLANFTFTGTVNLVGECSQ